MASLHPHKIRGWQLKYRLYFVDGTSKQKFRWSKGKQKAILIQQDLEKLEELSKRQRLTPAEITFFIHEKYITKEEAPLLTHDRVYAEASITWEQLETVYLKHVRKVGSDTTRKDYPYSARAVLAYFKSTDPARIREADINEFIQQRRHKDIAKATCNKNLTVLRIMFDHMVEAGAMPYNPARKIKDFTDVEERLPRVVYPAELKVFLKGIRKYHLWLRGYFAEMMLTYLYTGLRRSELLGLKLSDINFDHLYIRVERTKNNKERIIEIHPNLVPVLYAVIGKNGEQKGRYFFGGHDTWLVTDDAVSRSFSRFLTGMNKDEKGKKINMLPEGITLHSLRHTFISYLLQSGADLKSVQEIAGHKKLATTYKYIHLLPGKNTVSNINFELPE